MISYVWNAVLRFGGGRLGLVRAYVYMMMVMFVSLLGSRGVDVSISACSCSSSSVPYTERLILE
jgi:hypothetical protein